MYISCCRYLCVDGDQVSIVNPDGRLLVENLNFEVLNSTNVVVTGPNGSGKSSLFRVLGELW